jgi:hypothetical protein
LEFGGCRDLFLPAPTRLIAERHHRTPLTRFEPPLQSEKLWPLSHPARLRTGMLRIEIQSEGEFAMKSISRSSHIMGKQFGLGRDAIFRLWKAAIKDDEALMDEAIAETYERMVRVDPARAEEVMSLTIRRHRDAKQAFIDLLARAKARVVPVAAVAPVR